MVFLEELVLILLFIGLVLGLVYDFMDCLFFFKLFFGVLNFVKFMDIERFLYWCNDFVEFEVFVF